MASQRHLHDCVEIIYVLKGSGVNVVNEVPFPIMAGDLYVVNFGATHSFRADSELLFYNLMFHLSVFSKRETALLKEMPAFVDFFKLKGERREGRPKKLLLPPPFAERFNALFEHLHKELREGAPGFRMNAKARLILLITEMCRVEPLLGGSRVEASTDTPRGSLGKAMDMIHRRYLSPLSLAEIARTAGLSKTYIGEFFRERTGLSLVRYINTLRVEKARVALLERRDMNISEVAALCGFDDPSYFTKVFRELTGLPPKAYRSISG